MDCRGGGDTADFAATWPSFPLGGRLAPSAGALDFFGEEGEAAVSPRVNGIVLHDILSHVNSVSDVAAAVAAALSDGRLGPEAAGAARNLLESRVAAHGEWFPGDGAKAYRERGVIAPDGREYRPDRVVFTEDGVVIIDFKFGREERAHVSQVRGYASLYSGLGFRVKEAVVWYVVEDKCVSI